MINNALDECNDCVWRILKNCVKTQTNSRQSFELKYNTWDNKQNFDSIELKLKREFNKHIIIIIQFHEILSAFKARYLKSNAVKKLIYCLLRKSYVLFILNTECHFSGAGSERSLYIELLLFFCAGFLFVQSLSDKRFNWRGGSLDESAKFDLVGPQAFQSYYFRLFFLMDYIKIPVKKTWGKTLYIDWRSANDWSVHSSSEKSSSISEE